MTEKLPCRKIWATPNGQLRLCAFCTPEQIRAYTFSPRFGTYARFKSLYTHRESLEEKAAQPGANVVLALNAADHIVGFGVLAEPDPDERWAQLGAGVMMEVKAIEVSRNWRAGGVAKQLLAMMLEHPRREEMIVYMVGYSWTWDLDGSGYSAQQYRRLLIRLFEPFGFKEYQTNEPNVCLKPENLFMARVGRRVSKEIRNRFKWLLFGMSP